MWPWSCSTCPEIKPKIPLDDPLEKRGRGGFQGRIFMFAGNSQTSFPPGSWNPRLVFIYFQLLFNSGKAGKTDALLYKPDQYVRQSPPEKQKNVDLKSYKFLVKN